MPVFTPERAIMYLKKTPTILAAILNGVDQTRATATRDGVDGWNVLQIIAHLNDYEEIFGQRMTAVLNEQNPAFAAYNPDQLAVENKYEDKDFVAVFAEWNTRRQEHIARVSALSPDDWNRTGVHPTSGMTSVLEIWLNAALHDVNHTEQIIRVLGMNA